MKKNKKVNAAILIIGMKYYRKNPRQEYCFLSNWLNLNCGITVSEVKIIPDVEKIIMNNIKNLSKKFDYVFTTGGIGPTHDDITAQSIAKAFKVKYEYHKEAYEILENYYDKESLMTVEKMAKMPSMSYNPSSAAPGFITKNVLSLPGVPSILNSMIEIVKNI